MSDVTSTDNNGEPGLNGELNVYITACQCVFSVSVFVVSLYRVFYSLKIVYSACLTFFLIEEGEVRTLCSVCLLTVGAPIRFRHA